MLNPMTLQAYWGLGLFLLVSWQLSTGLRWIKLGKNHYRIHRATGITLFIVGIPHMLNGLNLAFGIFNRV